MSQSKIKYILNVLMAAFKEHPSSKELGFFNPRSQLNSTIVTYWPMQLKNEEDR